MDDKHKSLHETKIGGLSVLQNTKLSQDQESKPNVKATRATLESKLAQLSCKMKNITGPQTSNEDLIHRSSYHRLLVGNPECQIKVLEKNLKFLFQGSAYNYVQTKSNLLSSKTRLTNSDFESANKAVGTKTVLNSEAEFNFHQKGKVSCIPAETCNNTDFTGTVSQPYLKDKKHFFRQDFKFEKFNTLCKNMTIDKNINNSSRLVCSATQFCHIKPLCRGLKITSEEQVDIKKDSDNHFEFTVEEEKIVSFVCSPPNKENNAPCIDTEGSEDQLISSDQDSDKHSEMWADCNGEIDSLSEGVCSNSSTGNKTMDSECISKLKVFKPTSRSSKLLWHPPHSFGYSFPSISKGTPLSSDGAFTNLPTVSEVEFNDCSNPIKVHKTMASSLSRETTLFRETTLRGCYNMEQIVKDMEQSQVHVQEELKRVKESIFSAVRVHTKNEDLVSNSILSILDIFKSWLKLSSLFKDTELADILETNVGDMSIFNDFLQWQCMSRVFVDKMIDTLQKITQLKNNIITVNHLKHSDHLWFTKDVNKAENYSSFSNRQKSPCLNNTLKESILPTPEYGVSLSKNWKQRRFTLDQPKSLVKDSNKNFARHGSLQSNNFNNGCSKNHITSNSNLLFGQGDVPPLSYNNEPNFYKISHHYPNNSSPFRQGDVNIPTNNCHSCFHSGGFGSYQTDKSTNIPCTSKCSKQFAVDNYDPNTYFSSAVSNVTNDLSTISSPLVGQNSAVNSNFAVLPPFPNSLMCYTNTNNHYQINSGQFTVKQNPIQCTDSDVNERCTKSSYMKPGSYNIPEKPLGFQKVVNNNIPIEDSPVVGVPFLFSGSQGSLPSPKAVSAKSPTKKEELPEEGLINFSDDKWKAALSSAETFRDNLIGCKTDGTQNFKISGNELFETNFILSDDISHGSSSNVSKYNSESEDLSPFSQLNSTTGLSVVDTQSKTSDWLVSSFNKAVSEKEKEAFTSISTDKANMFSGNNFVSAELNKTFFNNETFDVIDKHITHQNDISCSLSNTENYKVYCDNDKILKAKSECTTLYSMELKSDCHGSDFTRRKFSKNNRKIEDDLNMTSFFDHKSSLHRKKTKHIFKKAVTKQVLGKLQDILNCICNTEVSSLVEFDFKSDKEPSKLEMKVRCPLYLQAMRCKLANNSYDTLDQALADFHKYFMDIRNRNKGDKLCIEAIGALEHLFLELVEKHFGSAPFHHQCFALRDLASTVKPRKAKKNSRRC